MLLRWIRRFYLVRYALLIVIVRAEEVFNTTPAAVKTSFSCHNRPMGFYADVEANCRLYHMCDDHGNQFSYRCPEETAFRQDAMICDHAHLVDCQATVYPPIRLIPYDNSVDNKGGPFLVTGSPLDSSLDDRPPSLSRTFRVIQRPDGSNKQHRSGFVFSASLFLRDQDRERVRTVDDCGICDAKSRAPTTAAFPRALAERYYPWNNRNDKPPQFSSSSSSSSSSSGIRVFEQPAYPRRAFEPTSSSQRTTPDIADQRPSPPPTPPSFPPRAFSTRERASHLDRDDHRSYTETLRSIQASATIAARRPPTTTEIPVHALTLSLKPLVPNELEYDPYYPRQPTTTEAYYTPSGRRDDSRRSHDADRSPTTRDNPPFKIPPVLPDLNNLEDLVDRRKFFYIPRAGVRSI